MERDLSSYRDRAQAFSGSSGPKKPGFIKNLLGMTDKQRQLGKLRKEHVRGKLSERRKYIQSHERNKRELFKKFDKGQLDEFQKYGISKHDYQTNPEATRKRVEDRLKRNRMRELHDLDISYNKQWREKAKEVTDPKSSPPNSKLA